jgi:hypothetical protein
VFANGDRDRVNDELRERARAGFHAPAADGATRERVLADARGRAGAVRTHLPRTLLVRVGVVLAGAAVVLGALMLQTARSPIGVPVQKASAAQILSGALAAVNDSSTVLHVIASTDTTLLLAPRPTPIASAPTPLPPGIQHPTNLKGGPFFGGPPLHRHEMGRHIEAEHWIDGVNGRKRTVNTRTIQWSDGTPASARTDQLIVGRLETLLKTEASGAQPVAWERYVDDPDSTLYGVLMEDAPDEITGWLTDTSNPDVFSALLNGHAPEVPTPETPGAYPAVTRTSTLLLGESDLNGVPVYRVQVASTVFWPTMPDEGTDTTIVASVRRSDYRPVQVEGIQRGYRTEDGHRVERPNGMSWVTRYRTVESLESSRAPDAAFRKSLPAGTDVRINMPYPAATVASSVDFPVLWLPESFSGLRFTGSFRKLVNREEYEWYIAQDNDVNNAALEADVHRPEIGGRVKVIAEYSPRGVPANRDGRQTTPGIKVISMPRTSPKTWERAFLEQRTSSAKATWTTVNGRRALHRRDEWRTGNGTRNGHITRTAEYLVFNWGNATVMVQGGGTKRGEIERAAKTLVRVK